MSRYTDSRSAISKFKVSRFQ